MINTLNPVNIVAVRVVFGFKEEYNPKKKVQSNDNPMPIELRQITKAELNSPNFKNLAGIKFGRFEVIGLAKHFMGKWVVRCKCGMYSTRKKKAILNPNNGQDRCESCRDLAFKKKKMHYKETGKDKDIQKY